MKPFLIVILCLTLVACQSKLKLPEKKVQVIQVDLETELHGDSLLYTFRNLIPAPLRIYSRARNTKLQYLLADMDTVQLQPMEVQTFLVHPAPVELETEVRFTGTLGDPSAQVQLDSLYALPFPKGKSYKILQGYNGSFSHDSDYSRYAIDFNLAVGDTICAAAKGVVVTVIENYILGANDKRLRDYANFITLYHPDLHTYTQYVHLKNKGSLVAVGDSVQKRQPIALSGNVGYTDGPHLHFNVLRANQSRDGIQSIPVNFEGGIMGSKLTKGRIVKHK